jgi:hypothetical protein
MCPSQSVATSNQGWSGNTGGGNYLWCIPVIPVLGKTPNFEDVGNIGK